MTPRMSLRVKLEASFQWKQCLTGLFAIAKFLLFIREHFIIILSPMGNLIAEMTLLLTSGLHCC